MTLDTYNTTQIPYIRLQGEPYVHSIESQTGFAVVDASASLDRLAQNSGYAQSLPAKIQQVANELTPLTTGGYDSLDKKLKHAEDLTFEESFSLMTLVISALNQPLARELEQSGITLPTIDTRLLQATALLSAMSTKESYRGLTANEIAGMVAATVHLDTVARANSPGSVLAFGGMGGDKGYPLWRRIQQAV